MALPPGFVLEQPVKSDINLPPGFVLETEPPSTKRSWGEAASDIGASLASGTGAALQFPGQLVGLVPGLRGVGETLAAPGEALQQWGEGLKSQGLKVREALRSKALSDAEKDGILAEFATAIKSTVTDPALLISFVTEQLPQLIGPGSAAKVTTMLGKGAVEAATAGAAKEAAVKALGAKATSAAIGTGAVMQGADIGNDTYKAVKQAALAQGMSEQDAEDLANQKARVAAAEAGVISLIANRGLGKLGGSAIEKRLAGVAGEGRLKSALGEALSEAVEEGGGKFASNVGLAEVDPNFDPRRGVGSAAGLGAIGGGTLGGILGGRGEQAETPPAAGTAPAETPIETARRKQAEAAAEQGAEAPPTEIPPLPDTIAELFLYDAQLKQMPKSKERDAAIKAAKDKRLELLTQDIKAGRATAETVKQFMTAEEAANAPITPRAELEAGVPPAEAAAEEEAPPKVRKPREPAPLPDVLDTDTIKKIGFTKGKIHDALVGKSITDPEIRTVLEEYKQRPNANAKTAAKIDAFLARLPEPAAPAAVEPATETDWEQALRESEASGALPAPMTAEEEAKLAEAFTPPTTPTEAPRATDAKTQPEAGGTSVPVAGEPSAGAAPQGAGVTQPVRVVPPVEDVGAPAAGEGQPSVAVADNEPVIRDYVRRALSYIKDYYKIEGVEELDTAMRRGLIPDTEKGMLGWIRQGNIQGDLVRIKDNVDKLNALASNFPEAFAAGISRLTEFGVSVNERDPVNDVIRQMSLATQTPQDVFTGGLKAGAPAAGEGQPSVAVTETASGRHTAESDALHSEIKNLQNQQMALLTKAGRIPAPKSKARTQYDALGEQIEAKKQQWGEMTRKAAPVAEQAAPVAEQAAPVAEQAAPQRSAMEAIAQEVGKVKPTTPAVNLDAWNAQRSDLTSQRDRLRDDIKDLTDSQKALKTRGGKVLPERQAAYDEVQRQIDELKAQQEAIKQRIAEHDKAKPKAEKPAKVEPMKATDRGLHALGTDTKTVFGDIEREVIQAVGRYNNPEVDDVGRKVAIKYLIDAARNGDVPEKAQNMARRALKNAIDRNDVPVPDRARYDELTKDVPEDETAWGSYRYRTPEAQTPPSNTISRGELQKIVDEVNKSLGGNTDVTILDSVTELDPNQKAGTRAGRLERGKVYLFRDGIPDGVEGLKTVFHELFHKGLRNLLSKEQYTEVLNKLYDQSADIRKLANQWMDKNKADANDLIEKYETEGQKAAAARALAVEEVLAGMAENRKLGPSAMRKLGNWFADVAETLGLKKLAQWLRGAPLNPLEQFIEDAIRASVNGQSWGSANRPGTSAFDRWFGNSKIVDEDGKPKVMYHGTARDITEFKGKQAGAIFLSPDARFAEGFGDMSTSYMVNHFSRELSEEQIDAAFKAAKEQLIANGASEAAINEYLPAVRKTGSLFPSGVPYTESVRKVIYDALAEQMPSRKNIMPVFVKAENPFNYRNRDHIAKLRAWDYQNRFITVDGQQRSVINDFRVSNGDWSVIEDPRTQRAIRESGFDSFWVREGGVDNIAVYNPTQIKSAIGNVGTYDPTNPDIRYRTRVQAPAEEEARAPRPTEAIGEQERTGVLQRMIDTAKDPIKLRTALADSLAGLENIFTKAYAGSVRDNAGNLNPIVLLSRALDALRVSEAVQHTGGLFKRNGLWAAGELTAPDGRKVSYESVLRQIANAAKRAGKTYEVYRKEIDEILYGHREFNLRKRNQAEGAEKHITLLLDDAEINRREQAFQDSEFIKGLSADLDLIRFNGLDAMVESGRLTAEQAQIYKDAIGYIPFNRIGEYENAYNSTKGINRGVAASKKMRELEGSDRKSTSVIENFSGLIDWMTKETMKTEAASRAMDDLVSLGLARRGNAPAKDSPGGEVKIYKDGKENVYYVPDPSLVVGFTQMDRIVSDVTKALSLGTRVLRAGVTAMPAFSFKQIFEDITRAYVYGGVKNNAELVGRVLKNFPKTWWNEVFKQKSESLRELERLGVVGTFDITKQSNLKNVLQSSGAQKESLGHAIMRVAESAAKASDLAVRQALYEQVKKETGDVVQAESAAREIINFSRRGTSETMATLSTLVPFFHAYARGMDKLAQAAAGKKVGMSIGTARSQFRNRMMVLMGMGLAYALMMQDDDDYQALPDNIRDTNWVLPGSKALGFTPVIPIPADLGFIFKAIPERIVRYAKYQGTEEEQGLMDALGELAKRGLDVFTAPNVSAPQVLRPFVENITNYSWYLGRPLESSAQQKLDPSQRYGTGTSDAMKALSLLTKNAADTVGIPALEVSPIKLENLVRGLFGTAAGVGLTVFDSIVNPDRTDRPIHQQLLAQATGASSVMKSAVGTRYMDVIYDLADRVDAAHSTMLDLRKKDPEAVESYAESRKGLLAIRGEVNAVMNQIRNLNKQAGMIDRDTSMPPDERRKLVDELRAEQNDIARAVYRLRKTAMGIQLGKE